MLVRVTAALRLFHQFANAKALASLARKLRTIGFGAIAVAVISGCSLPDAVIEPRGDTLNRTLTDYRNEATLLNIVRASYNEPMNFVTLASATGHSTLTGNEGIPTITLGPLAVGATRNYVFGPNTLSESSGNDFNIAVLDDPQSYSALMTPVDLAMIGFFLNRGLPLQLLLPIFVPYVRFIPAKSNEVFAFNTDDYQPKFVFCPLDENNHPRCEQTFIRLSEGGDKLIKCAATPAVAICPSPVTFLFGYLITEGLTVQVPAGALPGTAPPPPARVCFDPVYDQSNSMSFDLYLQQFGLTESAFRRFGWHGTLLSAPKALPGNSRCDNPNAPWFITPSFTQGAASAQNSSGGAASKLCIDGACGASKTAQTKSSNNKNYDSMFKFVDPGTGATIEFATRSTWGMYQYLGDVVRRRTQGFPSQMLDDGIGSDYEIFKVVQNDPTTVCFISVHYSGSNYCIPKDSSNSKRILSLLHELANLYTRPNNTQQPNTSSVRVTP